MKKYKDNDYELLYLISENNEDAKELFYEKYKPIIDMKAKKFAKYVEYKGYDINDLIQEGMIGLSRAINDFSEQKDVQFTTFANLCIERQMCSFMRNISTGRHKALNDSLSFENTKNTYGIPLSNILDDKNVNPETSFNVSILATIVYCTPSCSTVILSSVLFLFPVTMSSPHLI